MDLERNIAGSIDLQNVTLQTPKWIENFSGQCNNLILTWMLSVSGDTISDGCIS